MSELRVALVGSASVGKTTTAKLLQDHLNIEVHSEIESRIIRKFLARGIMRHKYDLTPTQSKAFQERSLSIRERLSLRPSYISDRTAGELWVYFQHYCGPHSTKEELMNFRERCLRVMQRYTHIFLFPFGQIPLVENNLRNINAQYQRMIYRNIQLMLSDFKVPFLPLVKRPLSREERLEEILLYLEV